MGGTCAELRKERMALDEGKGTGRAQSLETGEERVPKAIQSDL